MNFSASPHRASGRGILLLSVMVLSLCGLAVCLFVARLGTYAMPALCVSGVCALLAALQALRHRWHQHSADTRVAQATLQEQTLALADANPDALLILQPIADASDEVQGFRITHANGLAGALLSEQLGVQTGTLAGLDLSAVLPFLATPGTLQQYRDVLQTGSPQTVEVAVQEPTIKAQWLRVSATRFGQGLLLSLQDHTAVRELERQFCHHVHHDALTALPNRTLLDDRIQQSMKRARRNNGASAILLLDLDNFGRINETHGRGAGDHVLKTVAQRLTEAVRSTDSVLRLGGDEFVIVFDDIATHGPVTDFARKIVLSMFAPVLWQDQELHITASIGVAIFPSAGTTPETLLIQADIEMNARKRALAPVAASAPASMAINYGAFFAEPLLTRYVPQKVAVTS